MTTLTLIAWIAAIWFGLGCIVVLGHYALRVRARNADIASRLHNIRRLRFFRHGLRVIE